MAATYADALRWMVNLGYTQADLDDFIARNGERDIARIESSFNTYNDRALPTGGVAQATAIALGRVGVSLDVVDHTGMISPVAVPPPLESGVGALTQSTPSDAMIAGTGPRLAFSATSSPGTATLGTSATGVPTWVWIAGAIVLVLVLTRKGGKG